MTDLPRARVLTASAARVDLKEPGQTGGIGKRQSWQADAWTHFKDVPEVGFATMWLANAVSKVVLFAAWENEDGTVVPINSEKAIGVSAGLAERAVAEMKRLRDSVGGQARILYLATLNLEVAGEFFLHGQDAVEARGVPGEPDYRPAQPEMWSVRSVSQIEATRNRDSKDRKIYKVKSHPEDNGREIDNDTETIIRVWQEDPEWTDLSFCHLRTCMGDIETLVLLCNQQKAEAKSRQAPGILLVPSELGFADDGDPDAAAGDGGDPQEQPDQNPFVAALLRALTEPIEKPGSAGSVMPMVITGAKEYLTPDVFRLVSFARTSDADLEARISARIDRLARGLNVPVEVVMGHMSTTFSNAEQIDQDAYDDHAGPRVAMLADAFRYGFLVPNLAANTGAAPEDLERVRVGIEAGQLTPTTTMEENADALLEAGAISMEAYRRLRGIDAEDAPSQEEALFQLAARRGIFTADLTLALLAKSGLDLGVKVNADSSQATIVEDSADTGQDPASPASQDPPAPGGAEGQDPPSQAAQANVSRETLRAAGQDVSRETIGRRLAAIDRDLRARLQGAAEGAMFQALERAGNRVKAKLRTDTLRAAARDVPPYRVCAHVEATAPSALTAAGFTDDELLGGAWADLKASFTLWARQGGEDALDIVSEGLSGLTRAQRESSMLRIVDSVDEAWSWLENALGTVGRSILLNPERGAVTGLSNIGEWASDVRVPPGLIREALARAGGASALRGEPGVLTPANNYPVGGVATGEIVLGTARDAGAAIEAYQWVYGPGRRRTFHPHLALDGVMFRDFDDAALVNTAGWPVTPYFYPGDHLGCLCDFIPIVIPPTAAAPVATAQVVDDVPLGAPPADWMDAAERAERDDFLADESPRAARFFERFDAQFDQMTAEQRAGLFSYQTENFQAINESLRVAAATGEVVGGTSARTVRALDSAFAERSLAMGESAAKPLWRGIGAQELELFRGMKPGDRFVTDSFLSTTFSKEVAGEFLDAAMVKVHLGDATRVLAGSWGEAEVIVHRGTEWVFEGLSAKGDPVIRWVGSHVAP